MKRDSIFRIGPKMIGPPRGDKALMGFKGFNLARMARLGLPVPPAFVLGTPLCRRWRKEPERSRKNMAAVLEEQMSWLQSATGLGFGDPRNPLLVSVRSGAPVSMPGMLDTLLNIGLCDATARGLLRTTGNPRLVWDSYRRLVALFAEVVFSANPQPFRSALETMLAKERLDRSQELDFQSLTELTRTYLHLFQEVTGNPFPQNPLRQLELAVQAVLASWDSPRAGEYRRLYELSDDLCTAVTIQKMIFGNAGGTSGAGVGFTRDPDTGEKKLYFDFLFNSQGEDIVSGRTTGSDADRLVSSLPEIQRDLGSISAVLESVFGDVQEFEFTVQDGVLYLLQTRTAKRTPWAALQIAVELAEEGIIDKSEALARLEGLPLKDIKRRRLVTHGKPPLCRGQVSGSGVAIGPMALDLEAVRRFSSMGNEPPVLVRDEMTTADIAGIALSAGVLTARGNRTSHAAVVARQLGKTCITGCGGLRVDYVRRIVRIGDFSLAEGDLITLDSGSGNVFSGALNVVTDYPKKWLNEIRKWRLSVGVE